MRVLPVLPPRIIRKSLDSVHYIAFCALAAKRKRTVSVFQKRSRGRAQEPHPALAAQATAPLRYSGQPKVARGVAMRKACYASTRRGEVNSLEPILNAPSCITEKPLAQP